MKIYLIIQNNSARTKEIISRYHLQHDENAIMALIMRSNGLELYDRQNPAIKSIKIDFSSLKNTNRCLNFKKKMKLFIKR